MMTIDRSIADFHSFLKDVLGIQMLIRLIDCISNAFKYGHDNDQSQVYQFLFEN